MTAPNIIGLLCLKATEKNFVIGYSSLVGERERSIPLEVLLSIHPILASVEFKCLEDYVSTTGIKEGIVIIGYHNHVEKEVLEYEIRWKRLDNNLLIDPITHKWITLPSNFGRIKVQIGELDSNESEGYIVLIPNTNSSS